MGSRHSVLKTQRVEEAAPTDSTISAPFNSTARSMSSPDERWTQYRGHEIEPPLRSGAIALLDATWLVGHAAAGGRLIRRQDLPPEAFLSLNDLLATGQSADGLRVIAVSHAWLQPDHPDPFAHNLKILATVLEARTRTGDNRGTWGVFVDFCCLHQNPPGGQRSQAEDKLFYEALGSLGALYSHQFTSVFLLTALPPAYPAGYALPPDTHVSDYWARGWTFTEASWAMLTKTYAKVLDLGRLSGEKRSYVGMRDECIAGGGRRPPLTPSQFEAELVSRTFTNGKVDRPLVNRLYREGFEAQFERAQSLVCVYTWPRVSMQCMNACTCMHAYAHAGAQSLVCVYTCTRVSMQCMQCMYACMRTCRCAEPRLWWAGLGRRRVRADHRCPAECAVRLAQAARTRRESSW